MHTYLFVDGEYLRSEYNAAIQQLYQCEGRLDIVKLKSAAAAQRVFYYDSFDDRQHSGENEIDFKSRLAAQETSFGAIGEVAGCHVRLGSVRGQGQRRRRQKEVDVLLAVDMLDHTHNDNMERAVLLTGDLDFRPVVEAVVRNGVFVEVWYASRSGAPELPGAADYGKQLNIHDFHDWSGTEFQNNHRLPRRLSAQDLLQSHSTNPTAIKALIREGTSENRKVILSQGTNSWNYSLEIERSDGVHHYSHGDRGVLERYVEIMYGPIIWK